MTVSDRWTRALSPTPSDAPWDNDPAAWDRLSVSQWLALARATPDAQVAWMRWWLGRRPAEPGAPSGMWLAGTDEAPVWWHLMNSRAWAALGEVLSVPNPRPLALDWRDRERRGWCHWGVYHAAPDALVVRGLDLLGVTWSEPDAWGVSAPEALPSPAVAQAMARRWWTDQARLGRPIAVRREQCRRWAAHAAAAGRNDLNRVWRFWAGADSGT